MGRAEVYWKKVTGLEVSTEFETYPFGFTTENLIFFSLVGRKVNPRLKTLSRFLDNPNLKRMNC